LNKELSELQYYRGVGLYRRAAELLRLLPPNLSNRSRIIDLLLNEIERISSLSNLEAARRYLRSVRNRNINAELNRKARDLREKRREEGRRYGGGYNNRGRGRLSPPRRYNGESEREFAERKNEYERRKAAANRNEMARRRAARAARETRPPSYGGGAGAGAGYGGGYGGGADAGYGGGYGGGAGAGYGGGYGGGAGAGAGAPPSPGGGLLNKLKGLVGMGGAPAAPPPPLPPPQQRAINNAGGVKRAVSTIASVPGGAPEVAKAAEALNETGGNATQAVAIKGASPQAVKAVQNLGGVKNTVNVLEGLNTLSQTPATRRRKAAQRRARRSKKTPIRLTELNRVIDAVKKQKLISLMAHNITRTNNIHPNDEKRKKYYKKVMKAYLLKRPFATIVKKAAKKNV
jgi:hypothetical protein